MEEHQLEMTLATLRPDVEMRVHPILLAWLVIAIDFGMIEDLVEGMGWMWGWQIVGLMPF